MTEQVRLQAMKILERRDVSRKMLVDRLTEKGAAPEEAQEAADWLCSLGLLDDARYAGLVVRHYAGKGYGPRAASGRSCTGGAYQSRCGNRRWKSCRRQRIPPCGCSGPGCAEDAPPRRTCAGPPPISNGGDFPGRRSARPWNDTKPKPRITDMSETENRRPPLALISLGCPKNLVNSEEMLALLDQAGYPTTADPARAAAVIINTCAFIDDAKSEAIERILETAALRRDNPGLKILVAGCLAQRYQRQVLDQLPEVNGLVGTGSFHRIVPAVEAVLRGEAPVFLDSIDEPLRPLPRAVSTGPRWAYLRIAEGCNNRCAFCVIPSLRGRYPQPGPWRISWRRPGCLCSEGVRELIVVAQDITRYGTDRYGKRRLAELLRELCKLDVDWVRLHYLYPEAIDEELIQTIAQEKKIVRYLDIPIQHINDGILRRMNRRGSGAEIPRPAGKAPGADPGPGFAHIPDHGPARRGRGGV